MLLEVLSDFQISIPELGVIEARTHPIVVLTSNNSRELTEALKRRCLYLWLDYPEVEREMEIVRLHAPELDEQLARRLVEVVHMVRQLDLKKPPSIAESIDWARALLLLGADDIDRRGLRAHDEHHRQAPHRHRPGRRAGRGAARRGRRQGSSRGDRRPATPRRSARARAPARRLLRGAAQRGRRGRHRGDPRRLRGARARSPGPSRADFREALAATLAKSQEDRRVFELIFDRFFFRAAEAEALERGIREERRYEGGERLDLDAAARGDPPGDRARATTARCATSRGSRSPPSAARARARAWSASTCSGSAARSASRPAAATRDERRAGARPRADPALRAPPAPRARAGADRAHREAAARRGRSPSSTARCRRARPRTSPRSTARSPS